MALALNSLQRLICQKTKRTNLFKSCFISNASSCWFVFVHFPPTFWLNFLSLFWKVLLYFLYYLTRSRYLLSVPFSTNIFRFVFTCCVVRIICGCLFGIFSFCWVTLCFIFLSSFTCHSFFICPSILISYSGFVFLFGFLWGLRILSLTSFIPA